jgi:transposase
MAPLRGWAPCGQRLIGKVPHGRWKTTTFLAALRHDRIEAPWLLEGPIDGESFRLYVEKVLLPILRPGDIVILDNLGSHKSAELRRMIKAVGARLWYLPPYSPDLNPIEQTFAKIKHWMRNAQKRTIADLCRGLGELVRQIQPTECQNYFVNAGYAST